MTPLTRARARQKKFSEHQSSHLLGFSRRKQRPPDCLRQRDEPSNAFIAQFIRVARKLTRSLPGWNTVHLPARSALVSHEIGFFREQGSYFIVRQLADLLQQDRDILLICPLNLSFQDRPCQMRHGKLLCEQ